MIEFKAVKSYAPSIEALEIGEAHVFVRSNIVAIQCQNSSCWQYDEVVYDKNEYIKFLSERNALNESVLDTLLTDIIPNLVVK